MAKIFGILFLCCLYLHLSWGYTGHKLVLTGITGQDSRIMVYNTDLEGLLTNSNFVRGLAIRDSTERKIPRAIGTHAWQRQIFWSNGAEGDIEFLSEANMTGMVKEAVVNLSPEVNGIAVDWWNENLYFTDSLYNWIIIARMHNWKTHKKIISNLDEPEGIVVHPTKGYLFWVDSGDTPKIERSSLDGGDRVEIGRGLYLTKPHSISIDMEDDKIYWSDTTSIFRADFDGMNREEVKRELFAHYTGIAVFRSVLFAIDLTKSRVLVFNKNNFTQNRRTRLFETPLALNNIAVYSEDIQPKTSVSPCTYSGCSHICVTIGSDSPYFRCLCPEAYSLREDGITCVFSRSVLSPVFVYTIEDNVVYLGALTPHIKDVKPFDRALLMRRPSGFRAVRSLALHFAKKYIFAVDDGYGVIHRIGMQLGQASTMVASGLTRGVEALTIDWIHDKLFWVKRTNRDEYVIQKSNLDGGVEDASYYRSSQAITGMVIDPFRNYMYISVKNGNNWSAIQRLALNGTIPIPEVFVDYYFLEVGQLCLDVRRDRLYWTNQASSTLEMINLDGTGQRTIFSDTNTPVGITAFQDYVAWTDRGHVEGLHWLNLKSEAKIFNYTHPGNGTTHHLIMYGDYLQPYTKPGYSGGIHTTTVRNMQTLPPHLITRPSSFSSTTTPPAPPITTTRSSTTTRRREAVVENAPHMEESKSESDDDSMSISATTLIIIPVGVVGLILIVLIVVIGVVCYKLRRKRPPPVAAAPVIINGSQNVVNSQQAQTGSPASFANPTYSTLLAMDRPPAYCELVGAVGGQSDPENEKKDHLYDVIASTLQAQEEAGPLPGKEALPPDVACEEGHVNPTYQPDDDPVYDNPEKGKD